MNQATIECCSNFALQYEMNTHPALRALECKVLGSNYGGTSWTTHDQAASSVDLLGLRAGVWMLEVGSGSGWPSVFLTGQSGCNLTLLDLPFNALQQARRRASQDGLDSQVTAVAASGARLPFTTHTFEALGHSDVLCCLPEKQEMLKECHRVARPGARMLFYVIAAAPGLDGVDAAEASAAGPPFVDTESDYGELLHEADWRLLKQESLTADYRKSLALMVECMEADSKVLSDVLGPEEFPLVLERRRQQLTAVSNGLLTREMYLAEAK